MIHPPGLHIDVSAHKQQTYHIATTWYSVYTILHLHIIALIYYVRTLLQLLVYYTGHRYGSTKYMGIPMYFVLPRKLQEYYIRTKRFELVHIISQDHESDLQGTLSNVLVITFIVSPK